ncbi:MAG TPA: SDR family NAD(P)-dependent oxidoreductase [Baekduia sp.]|jgi:3-hydroxyacyl-CoA dehydrogenase/3-hydroxy-2-methylbutyryl-CoA dehydrogenase
MKIEGAVGLVTGGASGLGEGVVRMLAAGGGRAIIVDLPSSRGAEIAAELGDAVRFVATDVSEPEQVEAAVAAAVETFGRLDLTVNCAGVSPAQRILGKDRTLYPLEMFTKAVAINLSGLFDVVRWSAYHMAENEPGEDGERGLIVNVASIAGFEGQVGQAAYAASKGGVIALTIQLARDLERQGIRVMGVAPGMMDTAMLAGVDDKRRQGLIDLHVFPKRLGRPDEFARLVQTFMEVTLLNGDVVRLDAATRLSPR